LHDTDQEETMNIRWRLWLEAALTLGAGGLGILTLFWHDWIETVFGVDPDHGNGSLEWIIAFALLAIAFGFSLALRRDLRRADISESSV
jgi:hypothetical protein